MERRWWAHDGQTERGGKYTVEQTAHWLPPRLYRRGDSLQNRAIDIDAP
jgi:hypothetical protein